MIIRCLAIVTTALLLGCSSAAPRQLQNLNENWRFIRQDVAGAEQVHFDDGDWQRVDVPHTWNAQDGRDGGNDYYRGLGWYRRNLRISQAQLERSIFLRFDGASIVADVFVNGVRAGQHRGAFGAFCFDVTRLLKEGDNVIAVRVDNTKFEDVTPISGDWTMFGGLYRDVKQLVLDPLSISPLDDASSGVYLIQREVTSDSAELEIVTKLRNDSGESRGGIVRVTVADGTRARWQVETRVEPFQGAADSSARLSIPRPHLWNGLKDPHLYHVTVEMIDDRGKVTDRVTEQLGLRTIHIDPAKGFLLNGRPYPVRGVNRHQDRLAKGWATSRRDVDEDYALMRDMGVTAVRGAHYQHPKCEHALCDRLGILFWAELALVNYVTDSRAFDENAKQQLRELIKQNFNHPSIVVWSLYNELRFQEKRSPADYRLVAELNTLAHELDPSRLTTAASNMPPDHPMNIITDVLSFNRYFGWYRGSVTDWGDELDKIRATVPRDKAIGVSEYGAGASIRQHEVYPTTRPPTTGPWHPEEWQSIVHENAYGAMKDRPWIWGTFLWVMFDFASDGRGEGDTPGVNDKGMITGDRKTKKDAFYYYKSNWSDEPVLHITSKRFNPRPPGPTHVKVYSNCEAVELFVNGEALGGKSGEDGVFMWSDVALREGSNRVQAVGERAGRTYRDTVTWTVSAR